MLAAVFGTTRQTAFVGVMSFTAALIFGFVASDGNVAAQRIRLGIIAASAIGAVFAAGHRTRTEAALRVAVREGALLEQVRLDASTDVLTGALNRRGTTAALSTLDRSTPWTIAIADCNNFKAVNHRLGHAAGDLYLQTAATRLTRALSDTDVVGRWGGDEFLIAIPLSINDSLPILNRVATQVSRYKIESSYEDMRIALTFGAAQWRAGESLDDVILRADHAMYLGKKDGQAVVQAVEVRPATPASN
jgi:diguanylate cyclase (GGDEF)-like protein